MLFEIPGCGSFDIKYIVLDLNGTIAVDGKISAAVQRLIHELSSDYEVLIVSRDIHNNVKRLASELGVKHVKIATDLPASEQKEKIVEQLGGKNVIAIGNGNSDVGMLKAAAISIAVLGPEGSSSKCAGEADILTTNIRDAFECIRRPARLIATLQQ